jgi:hypothetical protein
MSNKKQTAVEWFWNQLPNKLKPHLKKELKQAKEMEKEQIQEAREDGHTSTYTEYDSDTKLYLEGRHEQYYNETFGGEQ